ncbi:hypothetical protein ACR78G_21755 [Sphingobacterium spiritivorum]|uniref:hypothetical protein n=1 Tax=Sphingobacterium spiritivorum TaxID=258 RepID=UPI003DA5B13F
MRLTLLLCSFICLLASLSCNESKLSKEKITALSLIGADISISQSLTDKNDNEISVKLFDKDGNIISHDSVLIMVNGVDMALQKRQGLYYTTETRYYKTNVSVDKGYHLTISLNGKWYALGSVACIAEVNEENIIADKEADRQKDYHIQWNNLKQINELSVSRSVLLKKSTPLEQIHEYREEEIHKISADGKFTVPVSYFSDSTSTISFLILKFNASKQGGVNPALIKGSQISVKGSIKKTTNFDHEVKP